MIIAIINQKGGTGKTCTAVHLAYWLSQIQNKTVQLIDADAQASSSTWLKTLSVEIPHQVLNNPNELAEQVPDLAQGTAFTVIDGAGSLSELTRVVLYYAHLALIPCQPTALDLHSSGSVVRLIRQAQGFRGKDLQAAAFLSRAIARTRLKDESIAVLDNIEGVRLLNTIVHQRQSIADAFGQQAVVWEMGATAKKAASEYSALFEEVMGL
jgi:chromosome partitioning protein